MTKRIAIVESKKIKDEQQKQHLIKICPVNKTGGECIYLDDGKLKIAENLCIGCGICVKVAPEAIQIINLPEALNKPPLHRYGRNGFHLYSIPIPIQGKVVGLLGKNGIGKSTAIQLLSGLLQPNFGKDTDTTPYKADIKEVIEHFKGTEAQGYFEALRDGKLTISYKPQLVDAIAQQFKGTVLALFEQVCKDKQRITSVAQQLDVAHLFARTLPALSGGELQRVAIATASLKDANVFFFDEPTSYLDVKQRLAVAEFLRSLAQAGHAVVVIEHDLIMLDAMSDSIHIMYGQENAYGVCSLPKATKTGINIYLDGFLKEENVRFRNSVISFNKGVAVQTLHTLPLCEWEAFDVHLPDFTLQVQKGMLHKRDVVGVLGENGIGKSSFVKALAGLQKTSKGLLDTGLRIGYKPQHLPKDDTLVGALLQQAKQKYDTLLIRPLQLDMLFDQHLTSLSGGQLQRVIVAAVLAKDVDLYLLDEPSAYLDVEQRLLVSKVIKDFMMHTGKTAIVVDHDLLFLDYLSDKLLVFEGTPGVTGKACGPFMMQEGMNTFLKELDITFRRDELSDRPRVNKRGSQMDQKQKSEGKLYYV